MCAEYFDLLWRRDSVVKERFTPVQPVVALSTAYGRDNESVSRQYSTINGDENGRRMRAQREYCVGLVGKDAASQKSDSHLALDK
jgi:hypothetical protein